MKSATATLLLTLSACTGGLDDPDRGPPGQSGDDTTAASSTSADPTTGASVTATGTSADGSSTGELEDTGSTDAGSVESTDTGPAEPPCEGTCLAVPPEWNGPVAIASSAIDDVAPECPHAYPEPVGEWYGDLVSNELSCGCGCAPDDVVCPDDVSIGWYGELGNCVALQVSYMLTQVCSSGPAGQNGSWRAGSPDVQDGSCTPTSSFLPTFAGFSTRWTLCGGDAAPGACAADESCAPAPEPFEERLCIWVDGDEPCPSGGFSAREVIHAEFDDQRGCAECTCGDLTGTCGGTLRLYGGNSCPSGGVATDILTAEVGDCVEFAPQSARLLEDLTPNDDIACEPSVPTPTGEAVGTGPITMCCTEAL